MLDWSKYITVANRYQYKAKPKDREDLNHDIIVSLAEAQSARDNNGGGNLSDIAMMRLAAYECQKYWRKVKRQSSIGSLNTELDNGDEDSIELIETIADDKAIDLDAWLDASIWLLGCPTRLIEVARKKVKDIDLDGKELNYLYHWRNREAKNYQKVLV